MNNLLLLKYAVEVEKTGSISRAAENLYMNQPNLSKAIRELESEVGVTLFERSAHGVVTTERGRSFLGYAKSILAQVAEMEALYKPSGDGRLRLDICVPRASYASFAFTEFIRTLGPDADIAIDYRETSSTQAMKNVAESVNHLAIIRYQTAYEPYYLNALAERRLQYEPIWEFSYRALMSRDHPLAEEGELSYEQIAKYTEILHGDLAVPALPAAEAHQMAKENEGRKTISIYERGSQFELLTRVPGTYIWVSPMPKDVLDRFDLVEKSCKLANNLFRDILVFRAGYRFSEADKQFLTQLRAVVDQLSAR